jgi:RNA-directed DNA polymerase
VYERHISWIVDADVSGFFDSLDHDLLRDMMRRRVKDGKIIRLIGKWLKAGVIEGDTLTYPDQGTPQGGVCSPISSCTMSWMNGLCTRSNPG